MAPTHTPCPWQCSFKMCASLVLSTRLSIRAACNRAILAFREQRLSVGFPSLIHDQLLTDQEKHDGNLRNAEEAPNARLLHQARCDEASQAGPCDEKEHPLDDHPLLLVQSDEWRKHQERVEGNPRHHIRWVGHRKAPCQVILA